ncbi:family 43 glycosylhydrolase [Peribacillus muralis]|uniref:family 43 glycosylhydrolase n=1 Tax=Peribacillus muralis TaxID=264697 RepID=UPI00366DD563
MNRMLGIFLVVILFASTFYIPNVRAADPTMDGQGLLGEFFKVEQNPDDRNDIGVFKFDDKRGERSVANLNGDSFIDIFNEFSGTPDFNTARFTGTIVPEFTEDYTFSMEGDDGFRLWVNGELIIDFWKQEWDKEQVSTPISLEAGKHYDIKVEYLQGWGGSWLRMKWESASQVKEIVPESALSMPIEKVISTKKGELTAEIQKVDYLLENFSDKVKESALNNLVATKKTAEGLLNTVDDQEVSDRDKAELLMVETKTVSTARSDFMKEMGVTSSSVSDKFNNPLYQGQDPFVTYKDGFYYFVSSSNLDSNNKVYVSKSRTLTDQGEKVMVFDSEGTETRIFAPEIFFFDGKWYIYYCADLKEYGYKHMGNVLESVTDDPQGEYVDKGALYLGENGENKQANDLTVFDYNGQLYAVWGTLGSGEPIGPAIAPMDNPYTITADRSFLPGGGGEGPRVLQKDGKVFITMSEGNFAGNDYRLSYFTNTDGDILNPNSWTRTNDVFVSTRDVSGPARATFVKSADGLEDWMMYHSRVYKDTGVNGWRQVNIKKFAWNEDGTPNFGQPVSPFEWQKLPSGDLGQGDMYQAEDGIHYGDIKRENSHANYQGTGYINLPKKTGAEASFVVNAEAAGDYIVGVRYAYGMQVDGESTDRPRTQLPARAKVNVYVNGIQVKTITPDKTAISWEEWFTGSERLALKAGKNVISYRIDNGSIGNVNIDYLSMYKADVPNPIAPTVPVTSVTLEPSAIVNVGETYQFNALVKPANYTNSIKWKSSNTDVAVVNSMGMVTGKAVGKAIIKANIDGHEVSSTVTIQKPSAAVSLEIIGKDGAKKITAKGGTLQLSAKVLPDNATDKTVAWSVEKGEEVASVSKTGLVTAKEKGTVVVKATLESNPEITDTYKVKVVELDTITLEANKTKLYRAKTADLKIRGTYSDGKEADLSEATLKYVSSNKEIVSIRKGVITAHDPGKAIIYVKVSLNGHTVNSNALKIVVKTSIESIEKLVDKYADESAIDTRLANQLSKHLDQAKEELDKGHDKQATKKMKDFLKQLNKKENDKHIDDDVKANLNADANALLLSWK